MIEAMPEMPLLWALRDILGLTGTKYSCGIGQCGACTVHVDGKARRSCITSVADVGGKQVTTIPGRGRDGHTAHPAGRGQCYLRRDGPVCPAAPY